MTERRSTEERKAQIIRATMSTLANDGLGRFTTSMIARLVGISEGALFRHYPSKEAIILDVVAHIERTLAAPVHTADKDPMVMLRHFFQDRLALLRREPSLAQILFSTQLEHALGPAHNLKIVQIKRNSIRTIHECLTRAQAIGLARRDLSVQALVLVITGMLHALVAQAGTHRQAFDAALSDDEIWHVIDTFVRGK